LGWLPGEVGDCYCADNGRLGIDPEVAVRLMLARLLLGIVHDHHLMREAQVNLAIRWFIGYGLHEALPDHSSLTRIRQRWGAARFRARWSGPTSAGTRSRGVMLKRWRRRTVTRRAAPDRATKAPPATGVRRGLRARRPWVLDAARPPTSKHTAVHGNASVVLDVAVTTGAVHDTMTVEAQLDAIPAITGAAIQTATMDGAYAITRVFASLEQRGIEAVVPAKHERPPKTIIPVRRFRLDAKNGIVRCPRGRVLKPHGKPDRKGFQVYRARPHDCRSCPLRTACVSPGMERRAILLHKDHPALLRARRKRLRWGAREHRLYAQHRDRVEGIHGEAKTGHGLARAVRRGLANMQIQAYFTAAVINLKRLAAALISLILTVVRPVRRPLSGLTRRRPLRRAPEGFLRRRLEWAPGAGQIGPSELTGVPGLQRMKAHGETPIPRRCVQASGRRGVPRWRDPAWPGQAS
jgi:IS5 family transposase